MHKYTSRPWSEHIKQKIKVFPNFLDNPKKLLIGGDFPSSPLHILMTTSNQHGYSYPVNYEKQNA